MIIVIKKRNTSLCFPRQTLISFLSVNINFLKFYITFQTENTFFLLYFIQMIFEIDFYFTTYQ